MWSNFPSYVSLALFSYFLGAWFPYHKVEMSAVWDLFSKQSTSQACASRRAILENVVSNETCKILMGLADQVRASEETGDELYGTNQHQLRELQSELNKEHISLFLHARNTMLTKVQEHFDKDLYLEYTHLTCRFPGNSDYSHGFHADQCRLDYESGECVETSENCCAWRSHSALLYLNNHGEDFEGGEFVFKDSLPWKKDDPCYGQDWVVAPKCGTMLMFSSGKENVHGVNKLLKGARYALAIWFTENEARKEEKYF